MPRAERRARSGRTTAAPGLRRDLHRRAGLPRRGRDEGLRPRAPRAPDSSVRGLSRLRAHPVLGGPPVCVAAGCGSRDPDRGRLVLSQLLRRLAVLVQPDLRPARDAPGAQARRNGPPELSVPRRDLRGAVLSRQARRALLRVRSPVLPFVPGGSAGGPRRRAAPSRFTDAPAQGGARACDTGGAARSPPRSVAPHGDRSLRRPGFRDRSFRFLGRGTVLQACRRAPRASPGRAGRPLHPRSRGARRPLSPPVPAGWRGSGFPARRFSPAAAASRQRQHADAPTLRPASRSPVRVPVGGGSAGPRPQNARGARGAAGRGAAGPVARLRSARRVSGHMALGEVAGRRRRSRRLRVAGPPSGHGSHQRGAAEGVPPPGGGRLRRPPAVPVRRAHLLLLLRAGRDCGPAGRPEHRASARAGDPFRRSGVLFVLRGAPPEPRLRLHPRPGIPALRGGRPHGFRPGRPRRTAQGSRRVPGGRVTGRREIAGIGHLCGARLSGGLLHGGSA